MLTGCGLRSRWGHCEPCGAERPYNAIVENPLTAARWERYQAARLGSDPLGHKAHEWPDLTEPIDVPADEPLRGWRMWKVGRGRLLAPYRPDPDFPAAVWQPGVNEASTVACWASSCPQEPHPSPRCWCGIRAVQSMGVLQRFHGNQRRRLGPWPRLAVAEVDLWGRVAGPAPGDDWRFTIRASHAQIAGVLYVGVELDAAALATRYDVETRPCGA